MSFWLVGKCSKPSVIALPFALLCYGILLYPGLASKLSVPMQFRQEFYFLLLLSIVCSFFVFLVGSFVPFVASHILHCASILIASQILQSRALIPEILILLPFLVDTAFYMEIRIGVAINSLVVALFTLNDILRYLRTSPTDLFPHVAILLTIAASVGGFAAYLVFYREKIVDYVKANHDLLGIVSKLSDANKSIQLYADNMEHYSKETERNRIARELHDIIGYLLTNIIMSMNAGKVLLKENKRELAQLIDNVRSQAEDGLNETRNILYRLRSLRETRFGGLNSIFHLCKTFQEATGVEVLVYYGNLPDGLGHLIDEAIYRFVQEGLTNSLRHGKATRVSVKFWQTDTEIHVIVSDNGQGIKKLETGIGLNGMRERFATLGGHIDLQNAVVGCDLSAAIPFRMSTSDEKDQDRDR